MPTSSVARLVEDRHRRGAGLERDLRRLLDDRTVHHRIAERDADLDGVGTGGGGGADRVLPARVAAGDVRHEQLAAGGALGAQRCFEHARTVRREHVASLT